MIDNVAYFIPSYGKAKYIPTLELLRSYHVSHPIYVVVGEDDPQLYGYMDGADYKVLRFKKEDYYDKVDSVGTYNYTHKVCTYARQFIDEYAEANGIRYICFMFDDIESVQLRWQSKDDKICSTKKFDFERVIDAYIRFLNCSEHIGIVGPPSASYYIGINKDTYKFASHYGNMFVYDVKKPIGPYKASVLEDMTIVLDNNKRGNIGLYPFGMQVNCRAPMATGDCYKGITRLEYVEHHIILTNGTPQNYDKLRIPYKNFTPKIISGHYKKGGTNGTI